MPAVKADTTPEAVPIHVALAAAFGEVGTIGKDRENKEQGYAFRSIEAIKSEVRGALARHGVVMIPEVVAHERWITERGPKRNPWDHVVLTIRYTFVGPDGSSLVAESVGEGLDNGDKAYTKAATFALKTLLTQMFVISDRDEADPDAQTPPEASPAPAPSAPPWQELGYDSKTEFDEYHGAYKAAGAKMTAAQRDQLKAAFPDWPMPKTKMADAMEAIETIEHEESP